MPIYFIHEPDNEEYGQIVKATDPADAATEYSGESELIVVNELEPVSPFNRLAQTMLWGFDENTPDEEWIADHEERLADLNRDAEKQLENDLASFLDGWFAGREGASIQSCYRLIGKPQEIKIASQ